MRIAGWKKRMISIVTAAAVLFVLTPRTMTTSAAADTATSAADTVLCRFYNSANENLYFRGIEPGTVTAKACVYSPAGGTYQLTACQFYKGRLQKVSAASVTVTAGTEVETPFTFTIPQEGYQDYAIKLFAWDSYKTMCPVATACELSATSANAYSNLFFDAAKMSALQTEIQSGELKNIYALLQTQANKSMSDSTSVIADAIAGRRLQIQALFLLMNGYLTQNEAQINKGIWFLTETANNTDRSWAYQQNQALAVGDMLMAYAVGYEWAKPFLTADEDQLLRAEMEEYGAWLYTQALNNVSWARTTAARNSWNWKAVCFGALGLAALALGGHTDWLSMAETHCTNYLTNAVDATGYAREGASYVSHGLHFVLAFAQAYQTQSGKDIFQAATNTEVNPQNLIDYLLYVSAPYSGQMMKINQSENFSPGDSILYIIMKTRSSEGLWAWLKAYGAEGDGTYGQGSWPGVGASLPFILLNYDSTLEPTAPTAETTPIKFFDTGGLAAKTGWGTMDALLTVNAGSRRGSIWNHADAGSITFSALGETFITDLGPGKVASRYHNIVQIDGVGQSQVTGGADASGIQSTAYNSTLVDTRVEDDAIYLDVDLQKAYNVAHKTVDVARRQVFYRLGDQPYVVLVDRVKKDTTAHTYTARLILESSTTAVQSGNAVTLTGGRLGAKCLVQYLAPGDGALSIQTEGDHKRIDYDVTDTEAFIVTVLCPYAAAGTVPAASFHAADNTITITQGDATERLSVTYTSIALK